MITLTEKAVEKVKEIAAAEGFAHNTIRMLVKGGGCAGFYNDLYFEEVIRDDDEIIEQDGVKVVVDPISMQYLDGTTLDYLEGLMSSGFKFLNPNIKGSCGCGNSVDY